jgi:hypothetical protein
MRKMTRSAKLLVVSSPGYTHPVSQPLLVIALSGRVQGSTRQVGRKSPTNQVGNRGRQAKEVEEDEEDEARGCHVWISVRS